MFILNIPTGNWKLVRLVKRIKIIYFTAGC